MTERVDPTLLRRRRAVEAAQLVARTFGAAGTAVFAAGWTGTTTGALPSGLVAACLVMLGTNVLGVINLRRPDGPRYALFSAAQVGCDLVVMSGVMIAFQRYSSATTWPGMAVPIVAAALRHRRRGALIAWAVTSTIFGVSLWYAGTDARIDLPFAVGLNLIIALITGTQTEAFEQQLRELGEARRKLERLATLDPLTGLANRTRLAAYASQHAGRALTVLLLDLNGFKQVNDAYGHACGDELLREIGRRMTGELRTGDLAGRLGGDEFLILLPQTYEQELAAVVDRLRAAITRPVDVGGRTAIVGVSIGTAYRGVGEDATLEELTALADAAMYRDKARLRAAVLTES